MKRRFVLRTTVLVAAGMGAACGASILGVDPTTGLSVVVSRGPLQPVAMEGETNDEPVPGAAVRISATEGGGAEEVRTGTDGTARILVRPGRYRVKVTECPGALALPGDAVIDVEVGSFAPVALSCDTGIR